MLRKVLICGSIERRDVLGSEIKLSGLFLLLANDGLLSRNKEVVDLRILHLRLDFVRFDRTETFGSHEELIVHF